jgi:IclR family acetate operon transcriptional repressor
MNNEGGGRAGDGVQSVERAISLLQAMGRQQGARVTDLAAQLGVHKSTVSRLLSTLEERGLVEQDGERGHYHLGQGIVQLAANVPRNVSLSTLARPICERLAAEVGETVNLAVLDGSEVVTVDQVIGAGTVAALNWVGQRSPLHATAAGKVFLAFAPPDRLSALLRRPLRAYTPSTITDRQRLRAQLEEVRRHNYSIVTAEHEVGLNAIGAPVRGPDGAVAAALTASGPAYRLTAERLAPVAEKVVSAARVLSRRNGYLGPSGPART